MARSFKKRLRRRLRDAQGSLETPWQRLLAHVDLVAFDLGAFRWLRPNLHQVAPGVYRSAQPSPRMLRRLSRQGVRTIVNLRGADDSGAYKLESRTATTLGLRLIDLRMKSRDIPDEQTLVALSDIFLTADKPLVFHCKSGADRAGLAAAIYLMLAENRSAAEAIGQLHWRFGHVRRGMPGILTTFLETYRDEGEPRRLGLIDWRRRHCDIVAVHDRFQPTRFARVLTDRILRRE
ncbi:tyrosine-protein phosphatase [Fodinicurvata sp. EGI_FJ10296]|uniref:fused DSP-PTPase phosphatase/NAD kinase-like protein n=1 Tax=Fodinicurvata sp. EGI_FJ10296 TaxID=3231908 RepID=UPI0034539A87